MKRSILLAMVVVGSLVLTLWVTSSMAASAGPVELRAITAWPMHVGQNYWFHEVIKEVNERAQKAGIPLTIKKLGGPEVIGTMQQFSGMRSGTVDMVYTSGDYFSGETIELGALGSIRPDPLFFLNALRETKVMDVVRDACREKSGCFPLFTILMGRGFTLLSTKPINPGNWSGLKIRSIGGQTAIGIPAMGGSAMLIPPAEVFEALQRGTVDGVMGAASDRYSFGERGVYKYILMPHFFESSTYWFVGAKVWDGLPDNMKTFLRGVGNEMEENGLTWCRKWESDTIIKYMNEDKSKLVWASPEEERKLAKAFRADNLEAMAKKSPKYGARIQELLKGYAY
jgi:TRAP-type transport system periplasmic protein